MDKFPSYCITSRASDGNMKDARFRDKFLEINNLQGYGFVSGVQVHGTNVAYVTRENVKPLNATDALITDDKSVVLGIFTADCMPVIISAKDASVVAAVHAGWRGLAAGIIEKTIDSFKNCFGISTKNLSAYIGAHICGNCYKVGEEVKAAFKIPAEIKKFSLSSEARKRLNRLDVEDVLMSRGCTFCGDDYFSYRKGNKDERILTLVKAGHI
jgi:YfiH family protein